MVLLKQPDDKITIVEHLSFPEKIKLQMLKKSVYGSPFKPRFMSANPKAGRKKNYNTVWKNWEAMLSHASI
jgi:hypothetical protein